MSSKYLDSLYNQIVKAPNVTLFSRAVRFLITYHLYKVVLPINVREAFVNDITEIFYQKFGYATSMDNALADSLSEYFMQEDVRVISTRKYTGSQRAECSKFEYSFDSVRKAKYMRDFPYVREVPTEHFFGDNIAYDGGIEDSDIVLDINLAMEQVDLTEREKEFLWLNAFVGLSVREIAEMDENFPQKTVVAETIKKAKLKLRESLTK